MDANDNTRPRVKWIYDDTDTHTAHTACDASSLRFVFYVFLAIKFSESVVCAAHIRSIQNIVWLLFFCAIRSFGSLRFGRSFRVVMKAFVWIFIFLLVVCTRQPLPELTACHPHSPCAMSSIECAHTHTHDAFTVIDWINLEQYNILDGLCASALCVLCAKHINSVRRISYNILWRFIASALCRWWSLWSPCVCRGEARTRINSISFIRRHTFAMLYFCMCFTVTRHHIIPFHQILNFRLVWLRSIHRIGDSHKMHGKRRNWKSLLRTIPNVMQLNPAEAKLVQLRAYIFYAYCTVSAASPVAAGTYWNAGFSSSDTHFELKQSFSIRVEKRCRRR